MRLPYTTLYRLPLIFFALTSSVMQLHGKEKAGRILLLTCVVCTVTALLAAIFAIGVLKIFPLSPVEAQSGLQHEEMAPADISSQLVRAFTVNDFSLLLSKQNMLALIVFSLLTGFAVRISGVKGEALKRFRSEERRVGKECVSKCRIRGLP